jgi:hypothetical protein
MFQITINTRTPKFIWNPQDPRCSRAAGDQVAGLRRRPVLLAAVSRKADSFGKRAHWNAALPLRSSAVF